jgi:glycosyltransferase involved in cell wall biosynthesis
MDGNRRYVCELLKAMIPLARRDARRLHFDIALDAVRIVPLLEAQELIEAPPPGRPTEQRTEAPAPQAADGATELQDFPRRPSWRKPHRLMLHGIKRGVQCMVGFERSREARRRLHARYQAMRRRLRDRLRRMQDWWGDHYSYDLIHLTLPNTWECFTRWKSRRLVTVHDLCHEVCPQFQNQTNAATLAEGLRVTTEEGADFLSVSHATADDFLSLYPVASDRVQVVYEGVDERFYRVEDESILFRLREKYNLPAGDFLLVLGTVEPRKNLENTVLAFNRLTQEHPQLDAYLIIAGAKGWGSMKQLEEQAAANLRIRRIGYVAEEDLPALYSAAAALSFVSFYEGFGLPAVEAMRCGTPVIYGMAGSLPEVVGDAGLGADPYDPQDIARQFHRVLADGEFRRQLSRRALAASAAFHWPDAAEQTLALYERCLARPYARRRESVRATQPLARAA